jgi:hypothetical protein
MSDRSTYANASLPKHSSALLPVLGNNAPGASPKRKLAVGASRSLARSRRERDAPTTGFYKFEMLSTRP